MSLNGCMKRKEGMKRRIFIEMDAEEGTDGIVKEIIEMVAGRMDSNVEFAVRQDILPENSSRRIEVPEFMSTNLHGRGVRRYG